MFSDSFHLPFFLILNSYFFGELKWTTLLCQNNTCLSGHLGHTNKEHKSPLVLSYRNTLCTIHDTLFSLRLLLLCTYIHIPACDWYHIVKVMWYSPQESACNTGNPGLIPGSGRSPGEGNGNPPWYSCLENSMDRGVWATVHGEWTRLSHTHTHTHTHAL